MKEMIYGTNKFEILDMGTYKRKKYVIISMMGYHPCAYVESNVDYQDDFDTPAHCGFTFYGSLSHWENKVTLDEETKQLFSRCFIGWDYGHCDDYAPFLKSGKKWTTEEILENVKEVIDWIIIKEYKNTGV
jgi:hypothetical protein